MKIAYINMQFPVPSETFCSRDINSLVRLGHHVDVYSMKPNNGDHISLSSVRHDDNLRYESLNLRNFFLGIFCMFSHPILLGKLLFWLFTADFFNLKHFFKSILALPSSFYILFFLKNEDYDIVHLFWGHYPSLVGFLYKSLFVNRVLTSFIGAHDLMEDYPYAAYRFSWCDYTFTHSFSNFGTIEKTAYPHSNVVCVHRGIPIEKFKVGDLCGKFNSKKLVAVGRLVEGKGFDIGLKLLAESSRLIDFELDIYGDGPDLNRLKALAAELGVENRIVFHGFREESVIVDALSNCFACLAISTYFAERLPNIVKEAMAVGSIPFVGESPGIRELVDDFEDGFIIGENYLEDFDAAFDFVADIETYMSLSLSARAKIEDRFSSFELMKVYLGIWSSLI